MRRKLIAGELMADELMSRLATNFTMDTNGKDGGPNNGIVG